MVAHKSCKDKFPHNCGLNEGQFAATLRSIGVDPSVLGRNIQEPDEATVNNLLERQNSLPDVHEKRLSILENIDMSMGSVRSRESNRLLMPKECSFDDFNIITMIGGGSFGKVNSSIFIFLCKLHILSRLQTTQYYIILLPTTLIDSHFI